MHCDRRCMLRDGGRPEIGELGLHKRYELERTSPVLEK